MMVASNILTENYNDKIISKRIPIDSFIISLPLAIDVLMELDSRFSFYFKSEIIIWVDNSVDFSIFGKEGENYIKSRIDLVWSQEYVTLEHPLKRKERLKNVNIKKMPSYHKILNEQFVLLPKIFKRIYE